MSRSTRKSPPATNPVAAGTKLHVPQSEAASIDGISSDHTDAAIIIPAAKPKKSVFSFSEISLLKKNTSDEPSVVDKNINEKPRTVKAV